MKVANDGHPARAKCRRKLLLKCVQVDPALG